MIMKINKYILGLAAIVLGGLSSCNTDVDGTIYNSNFEHVSFDGTSTSVSLSVNESSATIPVTLTRGVLTNASTITFTAEASEDGIFSNDANGSVSFAPGQNSATFNVTANNLQKDQTYIYTLTLSEAAQLTADTITGVNQNTVYTIKVSRAGDWSEWTEWNSEGTATFTYVNFWSGDDAGLPFVYRQSLNDPNKYQFKLSNWGYGIDLLLDYDKSTGYVRCASQFTGYTHSSYGDVYVSDIATYDNSDNPSDMGKFDEKQGIITIPLIYYVDAGYFGYGDEFVYIDGYVRADYTTEIAYFGRLTDANDANFLLADIAFGKDVEYVRYALVAEEEVDATIESLSNGGGERLTEAGRVQIPVEESGVYYLVVVAFAGDKAVASNASKIKFSVGGEAVETWTALYVGTYEYGLIDYTVDENGENGAGTWEDAGTKHDAILYQSDSDPNRYKIAPWAENTGEDGLIFTWGEDGTITVDQVYTGYTSEKYGEVYATDLITYGAADIASYYEDGVFYLNLAYHDTDGAWTYEQDAFTLTGEAGARVAGASKAKRGSAMKRVKKDNCKIARKYFAPILKKGRK
ncbi:MAG: hypothetical protein IJ069_11690 [Prevotella sp.]|nr:hypothetical protein [Prevotella sp.]